MGLKASESLQPVAGVTDEGSVDVRQYRCRTDAEQSAAGRFGPATTVDGRSVRIWSSTANDLVTLSWRQSASLSPLSKTSKNHEKRRRLSEQRFDAGKSAPAGFGRVRLQSVESSFAALSKSVTLQLAIGVAVSSNNVRKVDPAVDSATPEFRNQPMLHSEKTPERRNILQFWMPVWQIGWLLRC